MINKSDDLVDIELTPNELKSVYRQLLFLGFTTIEASNLIAVQLGLKASKDGWPLKQLSKLLFIKYIREQEQKEGSI